VGDGVGDSVMIAGARTQQGVSCSVSQDVVGTYTGATGEGKHVYT
jgi:hypothetical protein